MVHTCKSNSSRVIPEPNVRMCGWDCKPALRHLQTVRIPCANQNLSVFCANTKGIGGTGCPVLPQIRRKLIYHVPSANCLLFGLHVVCLCVPASKCTFLILGTYWCTVGSKGPPPRGTP